MLDVQSTTEQKVPIRINPKTTSGKDAALDGPATLSIVSGNATAAPATQEQIDEDTAAGNKGLVGYLVSEDTPGVSTWQISGDADLGEGVRTIVDGGSYTYNDPQAENFGLTAGEAVPK
jgi:hypothetical protein